MFLPSANSGYTVDASHAFFINLTQVNTQIIFLFNEEAKLGSSVVVELECNTLRAGQTHTFYVHSRFLFSHRSTYCTCIFYGSFLHMFFPSKAVVRFYIFYCDFSTHLQNSYYKSMDPFRNQWFRTI